MPKNKHYSKSSHKNCSGSPLSAILKGLIAAIVCAISMITLSAIVVFKTPDPGSLTVPAALASLYICGFVGGFAASLAFDGDVLCGVLCGGTIFTVIVLLSLLLPGGAAKSIGMGASIGLHAVSVPFSLFGALAASSIVKSRSRRRRRKRQRKNPHTT